LLFVESWNDWHNQSAIEPSLLSAYAWLQGLRDGLAAAGRQHPSAPRLIIAVHAYYLEIFEGILARLKRLQLLYDLVVTCSHDRERDVVTLLRRWGLADRARVAALANRGRDVAPFLSVMADYELGPDDIVLKLHTKRSDHRPDGGIWRDRMLAGLLDSPQRVLDAFRFDESIGMVAPSGVVSSVQLHLASNRTRLEDMLAKLDYSPIDEIKDVFAAGSMFFVRARHLDRIIRLQLSSEHFEAEAGQLDGTLAHALERLFTLVVLREGAGVVEVGPSREGGAAAVNAQWRLQ
jgi:lipopolysaccharide biosynthesis protein